MRLYNRKFLYNVAGDEIWANSHCHKPTPLVIDDTTVRVYFGTRSKNNISRTTFVDIDVSDVKNIAVKTIHDKPVFDIGKIGTFDDSGANVSSVIDMGNGQIYMYYIGWNPSTTVHTRNSIGLIFSHDNGISFTRKFDGSILDRTKDEPYYTGAVDVKLIDSKWKIWYTSGKSWKMINGKPEIQYSIKYAESENGIDWIRNNIDCIPPSTEFEATARPSVVFKNDTYYMFYSKRNINGFRTNKNKGYRAGFAVSKDGINWVRKDKEFPLTISESGWDSEAIAYPYVINFNGQLICFFNGNGFGKTGFGYVLLDL